MTAAASTAVAGRLVDPSGAASISHPVLLIRHAATAWTGRRWCGRADPVLTAEGRDAARRLANDLAGELASPRSPRRHADGGIALLVSPARRARQTAAFIEAVSRVAAIVEPDLVEVDVGVAEGLDWTSLERRFPTIAAEIVRGFQPDWPGGESRADVDWRAALMADRIRAVATERTVIVVSHGAILHAIAALLVDDDRPLAALGPAAMLRLDPPVRAGPIVAPADTPP